MNETLAQINALANERHMLYRLAGKQHLSAVQSQRVSDLTTRLYILWDQYRRELAGGQRTLPYAFGNPRRSDFDAA